MIDIHTHILPGIDDGAEDIYDTLEMAQIAADAGVTSMVATPHCNIPGVYENYFGETYKDAYYRAVNAIKREGIPLELMPGMEVFATEDLPKLMGEEKIMTLNQSRYLLMEFAFDEDPDFANMILHRVRELRARPVVAHAERYEFIQDYPEIAYEWRKEGYLIQVNKGSFLGRFGSHARIAAYQMLDHNLIAAIASDAHGPSRRTPYMLDAYEELCVEYPESYLEALFCENPRRICSDQPEIRFSLMAFGEEENLG